MMNRSVFTCVVAALLLGCGGCATLKPSLYNRGAIAAVNNWHVDFTYEAGRFEETVGTQHGEETKVVKEGHPPVDLQLRDDIFFHLRDKYAIRTVRKKGDADGFIRLHPLHFRYGSYKSLDVMLQSPSEEILGRIRIENGDRNATIKDNVRFAKYSADAIGKVITDAKRVGAHTSTASHPHRRE